MTGEKYSSEGGVRSTVAVLAVENDKLQESKSYRISRSFEQRHLTVETFFLETKKIKTFWKKKFLKWQKKLFIIKSE